MQPPAPVQYRRRVGLLAGLVALFAAGPHLLHVTVPELHQAEVQPWCDSLHFQSRENAPSYVTPYLSSWLACEETPPVIDQLETKICEYNEAAEQAQIQGTGLAWLNLKTCLETNNLTQYTWPQAIFSKALRTHWVCRSLLKISLRPTSYASLPISKPAFRLNAAGSLKYEKQCRRKIISASISNDQRAIERWSNLADKLEKQALLFKKAAITHAAGREEEARHWASAGSMSYNEFFYQRQLALGKGDERSPAGIAKQKIASLSAKMFRLHFRAAKAHAAEADNINPAMMKFLHAIARIATFDAASSEEAIYQYKQALSDESNGSNEMATRRRQQANQLEQEAERLTLDFIASGGVDDASFEIPEPVRKFVFWSKPETNKT